MLVPINQAPQELGPGSTVASSDAKQIAQDERGQSDGSLEVCADQEAHVIDGIRQEGTLESQIGIEAKACSVDDHETVDSLGEGGREGEADPSPHRVADERDAPKPEIVEERMETPDLESDAIGLRQPSGRTEARQIWRQHIELGGEGSELPIPIDCRFGPEAVNEYNGGTRAPSPIAKPSLGKVEMPTPKTGHSESRAQCHTEDLGGPSVAICPDEYGPEHPGQRIHRRTMTIHRPGGKRQSRTGSN
jgi:hypothetical protein